MLSTKIKILIASFVQKTINVFYKDISSMSVIKNDIHWDLDLREGIDFSIFMFGYFEKETTKALSRLIKEEMLLLILVLILGHTLSIWRKM